MDYINNCDYVIEKYVDEYKTICQSIMYQYDDPYDRQYQQAMVNPHCTKLVKRTYYSRDHKILFEEVYLL